MPHPDDMRHLDNQALKAMQGKSPQNPVQSPQTGDYRFVVCIDVEGESLEDAYGNLYRMLGASHEIEGQWESSNEAFGPNGEQVDVEALSDARSAFYENNPHI